MKYLMSAWIGIIFLIAWQYIPELHSVIIGFIVAALLFLIFCKAEES